MKKLNPKVFRYGDIVQIINPEFFVRCGYPLTLEDAKERLVSQKQREMICALLNENYCIDKIGYAEPTIDDLSFRDVDSHSFYHKILDEVAYFQLYKARVGGNERKIYTERIDSLLNSNVMVTQKRYVKTGKRVSGGYDEDGGSPPYLSNEKTHVILTVYVNMEGSWCREAKEIEAKNVIKL